MKYYAGIGSRETPAPILNIMAAYAGILESRGYILRSGGADGADSTFANAVWQKDIYLPWRGFNGLTTGIVCGDSSALREIAAQFHPAWGKLSRGAMALHTRNVAQVLGADPQRTAKSDFVLCWTPGAKGGGGTGQAIRIARGYDVPVYDLADLNNTFERDWL